MKYSDEFRAQVVAATFPPNERQAEDVAQQLGEWLRGRGLDSQHLTLFEQEIREVMTNKERRQREEIGVLRRENRRLEREVLGKDKALAELTAILAAVDEAQAEGVRPARAAAVCGYSRATLDRWRAGSTRDRRKGAPRHVPRKLSPDGEREVVRQACVEEHQNLTPHIIVPKLLTSGIYVASVSTMYRILCHIRRTVL